MKKIEIITRPFYLDEIKDLLSVIGVNEAAVSDIRVSNANAGESHLHEDYFVEFMPKIKIELYVEDSFVDKVVAEIKKIDGLEGEDETSLYSFDVEKKL